MQTDRALTYLWLRSLALAGPAQNGLVVPLDDLDELAATCRPHAKA